MAAMVAGTLVGSLMQTPAWSSEPDASKAPADSKSSTAADAVPAAARDDVLGAEWKKSADVAWTTTGDAQGFHVLTAREQDGYTWQTTATLAEPGFDTDAWIGNACITASGKRAVVTYAPRTFTNKPQLMARGAFTAVVDLNSGEVRKLATLASLSYYNPGCGDGEEAVLTQSGGDDLPGTRLIRLDTVTGKVQPPIKTKGQVTSAVPFGDHGIAAAVGNAVAEVSPSGSTTPLARTDSVPYRLAPDGEGGIVFLDKHKSTAKVKWISAAHVARKGIDKTAPRVLAQGATTETGLVRSGSRVYVTGPTKAGTSSLPKWARRLPGAPKTVTISTTGAATVTAPRWADGKGALLLPGETDGARKVKMTAVLQPTDAEIPFVFDPDTRKAGFAAQGTAQSPGLTGGASATSGKGTRAGKRATVASSPTEPIEDERTCAVPRNDPRNQAMQPKPRQVEWAVDQAVKGYLNTWISRPANWKNLGMPAYSPQTLFLNPVVEGGDRTMAQVMLGVTTQESNMWQAGREAVPGVTANPLIGNYYGIDLYDGDTSNDWDVDFAEADCGYGISQVTDHMRLAGREDGHGGAAWDYQKQRAVALDYTANIAAGLQILVQKWNETRSAGMTVNHGSSLRPENWYYALWAYNSGFHAKTGDGTPWGLGWANNPANPEWDASRLPFMENAGGGEDATAAAHPQNWPYQEKVLGFAAHPPSFLESPGNMVPAFRPATWNGNSAGVDMKGSALYNRAHVKAPEDAFCDSSNFCNPGKISDGASNDDGSTGPCGREDFHCWWSKSVTWKDDCSTTCGYEFIRFNENDYPEEPDGTAYPPVCTTSGLPSGALIVDDVPDGTPVMRPGCSNDWKNSGKFTFSFSNNGAEAVYPSKVDLHQLGAGFGGHFYFAHTRKNDAKGNRLMVTGAWSFNDALNGPAKVLVHLPDHGAQTKQAKYVIDTGLGVRTRVVSQPGSGNRWVNIGAFMFKGKPKITLKNITQDGTGDQDIAYDAVAVAPIKGTYVEHTVEAVGFFDEDQNLDADSLSTGPINTPFKSRQDIYDWGVKTSGDVTSLPGCIDLPAPGCAGVETRAAMERWNKAVKEAGVDPSDHPDGKGMTNWLHYSNPYTDRPTSASKPARFDTDDSAFKIRNQATVSFVKDDSGKVISGSEYVEYDDRTADTHVPDFIMETFAAIEKDYHIDAPNLNYTTTDLNEHNGLETTTNTNSNGIFPGRAYAAMGLKPTVVADGTCVRALNTSGGSIGYRPMLSNSGVTSSVENWKKKIEDSSVIGDPIAKLAGEIYNAYFKPGVTGSLQNQAPPIWEELSFQVCADGTVKPYDEDPILRASHMPSQYLYLDGTAIDQKGAHTNSAAPLIKGNFSAFSSVVDLDGEGMPYGRCGPLSGQSGNPWGIDAGLDSPGTNPSGKFCSWPSTDPSPEYSS
ncbi:hypothetical protein AB0J21_06010 [Streptomyces sp. NPDC049954]|uniref:golvesin C-terminal-like domain-containing protein n=1 Tax=Streptomyces sp. NPDC049954 TaxID=3155779 RepID=UPI00342DDEBE